MVRLGSPQALRRRSPSLLAEVARLPPSAWRTITLDVPHRKYRGDLTSPIVKQVSGGDVEPATLCAGDFADFHQRFSLVPRRCAGKYPPAAREKTDFYAPMIRGEGIRLGAGWTKLLAKDYCDPRYHISFARAIGRRLRRTYAWIFLIQAVAYYGKLAIHPTPLASLAELWERAAIGPIPGVLVVVAGVLFHGGWAVFALITYRIEIASRRERRSLIAMG